MGPPLPSAGSATTRRARFSVNDDPDSDADDSPETPSTPTFSDLKRTLSFSALKELEAKDVSKALWRGKGEKRRLPQGMEQILAHSLSGGARSLLLASSLRAGVNLLVLSLRITKKKGISGSLILQALFGQDTMRFGLMLGSFTFLYKFMLHSLRVFNFGTKGEGQEEWWHAGLAGAVSGLAVAAEKPSRRVTIGQQLLVRGLQGNFNIAKAKGYINIPNGDIILFGFAVAQIMYSWLMAPEALPPGYRRWVTNASRVAAPCLPVNLSAYRNRNFDIPTAMELFNWRQPPTAKNAALIDASLAAAANGDFGPPFAPCAMVHPWMDSCGITAIDRWQAVFRWMFPVYAALHVIPPILLRRKVWFADPSKALLKSAFGTLRSCGFLATFVTLFQGLVCTQRNFYWAVHGKNIVPLWLEQLILHKGYYWVAGFSTCVSLFFEEKKRRGELAMYVLPKGMEALWSTLRRRYIPAVPGGDIVLASAGMSLVMSTYHRQPKMLSGLVRSILYQFVGRG